MALKLAATELADEGMCFGCGPNNPDGLHLKFRWEGDTYCADFNPGRALQGWAGRVHGGMIALVLDEVLARAALDKHGLFWVTAELTTRFIRPALIHEELVVRGRIDSARTKLIHCSGDIIHKATGALVAVGTAKLMRAKQAAT